MTIRYVMNPQREWIVRQVLQGLSFPAAKWQILTHADLYGADNTTRRGLTQLPTRSYLSPADVTAALDER